MNSTEYQTVQPFCEEMVLNKHIAYCSVKNPRFLKLSEVGKFVDLKEGQMESGKIKNGLIIICVCNWVILGQSWLDGLVL